jgi:hypothetical protein
MQAVGALGFAVAVAAARAVGPTAVAVVAVAAAAVALLDAALLFGRAGAKAVLPVAAIPGLVLPVLAALSQGDEGVGWHRVGEVFALAVMGGFALVLVFGRRRGVVAGLGVAFASGLLVGLGAASLVLLEALGAGLRWVLALAALAASADVAAAAATALQERRRGETVPDSGETPHTLPPGVAPLLATIAAVAVVALVLVFVLEPPFAPWVAAVLAAAVAVAALGGEHLRRMLTVEAGLEERPSGLGTGSVLGAVDALLLSAPVAYVLARAVLL